MQYAWEGRARPPNGQNDCPCEKLKSGQKLGEGVQCVNNDTQLFCVPVNVVFPMVVESTFELEFTRIAGVMTDVKVQIWPRELHSFYDNIICTSKTKTPSYFSVIVFVCTIFTQIFFRFNNIR